MNNEIFQAYVSWGTIRYYKILCVLNVTHRLCAASVMFAFKYQYDLADIPFIPPW